MHSDCGMAFMFPLLSHFIFNTHTHTHSLIQCSGTVSIMDMVWLVFTIAQGLDVVIVVQKVPPESWLIDEWPWGLFNGMPAIMQPNTSKLRDDFHLNQTDGSKSNKLLTVRSCRYVGTNMFAWRVLYWKSLHLSILGILMNTLQLNPKLLGEWFCRRVES